MTDNDRAAADRPQPDIAAELARMSEGTLAERMHIELVSMTADLTTGSMPVAGNTQPYGLLHGGASVVLAETLGSVAAAVHAGPGRIAVGVDVSATHHRAAREGNVHGEARPLSLGGSIACYEIVITDDEGHRTCTARLTCALRDRPPGG